MTAAHDDGSAGARRLAAAGARLGTGVRAWLGEEVSVAADVRIGDGAVLVADSLRLGVPPAPDGRPDLERAAALATPRTRALILNSPGNPAGCVLRPDELAAVAELAQRHDLTVVADEVYEHVVFDGQRHVCTATVPGLADRTVVVSSAAKTLCVTGWKIGWATGPADLLDRVHRVKQYLSFASGTPFQYAVAESLGTIEHHVAALGSSYQRRRDELAAGLRDRGFEVQVPEGGYFVLADATAFGVVDTATLHRFCRGLPAAAGVVGIPGSLFTTGPDVRTVRFCFAKSHEKIAEALRRLAANDGSGGTDRA